MFPVLPLAAGAATLLLLSSLRVLPEYQRGVVFRLGRVRPIRGPGLNLVFPLIERLVRVSLRTHVLDVEKQDVITRDNVSVAVNAVVYLKVVDPRKAVLSVEDYLYATGQLAQTTLRSVTGQAELDELLAERESINAQLKSILDEATDPWGVKVTQVEVKHIDLPSEMRRAMARQAEAERDRRAKVIGAAGELEASEKLSLAAQRLETSPVSVQLRYLQTLTEVAAEQNSTTIFPVPIDLFRPFVKMFDQSAAAPVAAPPTATAEDEVS